MWIHSGSWLPVCLVRWRRIFGDALICLSFWEFFGVRSLNLSPSLTSLGKRVAMQNSNLNKSTNYMGHGFSQISKLPADILEGQTSPMVLFQVEPLNSLLPSHSEFISVTTISPNFGAKSRGPRWSDIPNSNGVQGKLPICTNHHSMLGSTAFLVHKLINIRFEKCH